jgi:hypothetical protein
MDDSPNRPIMTFPHVFLNVEAELAELKNILKMINGLEEIRTPDLRHVKATS